MSDWGTLCNKCEHHIARPDAGRSHAWYNHFCEKAPLRKDDKLPLDRRFFACRYINPDNACKLYEPAVTKP